MGNNLKKRHKVGLTWSKVLLSDLTGCALQSTTHSLEEVSRWLSYLLGHEGSRVLARCCHFVAVHIRQVKGLELRCPLNVLWDLGSVLNIKISPRKDSSCKIICDSNLRNRFKSYPMTVSSFHVNSSGNTRVLLSRISELCRHTWRRDLRERGCKTGRQTSTCQVGRTGMFMYRSSVNSLRHLGKRLWAPFRSYLEELRQNHSRHLGSKGINCILH